jgi:hypothetical protein
VTLGFAFKGIDATLNLGNIGFGQLIGSSCSDAFVSR